MRCLGLLAAGLLGAAAATPAAAATRSHFPDGTANADPASLCEAAIGRAETRFGTPTALLAAISLVETGRPDRGRLRPWPWSVDVDGAALVFPTKAEAISFTGLALASGAASVDVGCMQVNLEQHPDAFASLDEAFDPARNVTYAARFLLALRNGPAASAWATAVGFYHSQTPPLAASYRARVIAIDDRIAPPGPDRLVDTGDAAAAGARRNAPPSRFAQMQAAWAATTAPDDGSGS